MTATLSVTTAVELVRRVIAHAYTTEVGESARLGRLENDLARLDREGIAELGKLLGAWMNTPSARDLVKWVRRQRQKFLADSRVRREKIDSDATDTTSPVVTHGKVLPRNQQRRGKANNY